MGSRYESNGANMHTRTHPELVDGSGSSTASTIAEVALGQIHGRDDETDSKIHRPLLAETLTSSLSSSSTDSSSGDFFQVDTNKLAAAIPIKRDVNAPLITRDDENDVPSFSTVGTSFSHVSDIAYEPILPTLSPIQSPPTPQVMDRSSISYNPSRIPASVFSSKPATPLEWSLASNESLFSIHVGNISFSREHFTKMGGDKHKSKELTKPGETVVFTQIPPSKIAESNKKNESKGKNVNQLREAGGLIIKDVHKIRADDQGKKKIVPHEISSVYSDKTKDDKDGNGQNGSKIRSSECQKKKKCWWPFRCCCSHCSCTFCAFNPFRCCLNRTWGFCSCKWPKCSCKWPKCLCTWPRCSCTSPCHCCFNCSSCSFCCCKRPRCNCSWLTCHCCSCNKSFCHCSNCSQTFCQCFDCRKTCSSCCNCSHAFRNCCNCCPAFRNCCNCCPAFRNCCNCSPAFRNCCNCSQAFSSCWSCSRKVLCCFSCTICASGTQKHQQKQKHACKWLSCSWFKCCTRPKCDCCC